MRNIKRVSVVVITHNGKRHLKECFDSLKEQTYKDFDVYLIDNASTDGTMEYVKEEYPWVKVIHFDENYGFAKGYNEAIKKIDSEYVALLNDDTKVDSRWLEELVSVIDSDEEIFAVGSKILFYDEPSVLNHAGGKITIIGGGIDVGFGKEDSNEFNRKRYVGTVSGASMLLRRDIFEELGGFDEDLFAYFEESDLCWRAWLSGYKVMYVPTSIVYHKFGGSWGDRASPRRIYYVHRNKLINTLKNFELKNVIRGLIVSFFFDTLRIILFLFKRKYESAKAIIKANIDFLKQISQTLEKRRKIQKKRKIKRDDWLIKRELILPLWKSIKEFIRFEKVKK